jgi:hypothetical protein
MARIELRDCTINLKDGLAGTAAVKQGEPAPAADDTTLTIDTPVLNTADTGMVPVGARFQIAGETVPVDHVVLTRTPPTGGPTTAITFAPKLGAGTYAAGGVLTFKPNQLSIKMGDGDVDYTEHKDYVYELDRDNLDTVKEGKQVPMDVKIQAVYEHITTGTGENISPMDALKQQGGAAEWVSSSADLCEPFAVDLEVVHTPPCGTAQTETTLFPDFRADSKQISFKNATIQITGKCNAVEPVVSRS